MKIRLHGTERKVATLGPGKRYVIWVQGCARRCPGCISPETWDMKGGYEDTSERLAQEILASDSQGITVSGGEPFLQAEPLVDLLLQVKSKRDVGVIIYTGNTYEDLLSSEDNSVQRLLSLCDLLVDGEYKEEMNDGKNLWGSSNQRALPLTDRYRTDASDYGTKEPQVEFFVHEGVMRMVGIPSKEMLERFNELETRTQKIKQV